ncbi:response regulator [candidate division CSSED10-310 bacterium]|uniref:Response regulator n=1 Tax=candidate division CSSED10-310 bacterium TaxID=2855610 RepID=A0ABV6Z015_UNCC1
MTNSNQNTSVSNTETISKEGVEILIVDDEDTIITMLTHMLEFEGYKTRSALNGQAALSAVHDNKPSLIILDLMMPGISGFEVCKELKTQREYSPIPVIMLTAKKGFDDRVTGLRVGANDYITKPFNIDELLNSIEKQLINSKKMREQEGIESTAKFEVTSDFTYIKQVNDLIMRIFGQTNLTEEEIVEFEYCLNEALINAVEHGSGLDPDKLVYVSYTLKKDKLIIEIEDEGQGFDFRSVADPTTEENILNPRGRGIFIMKNYMDEVFYNEKGTKITLIKNLVA